HSGSFQIAMARLLLISFFFLSLTISSSAYRLVKRDHELINRYCGVFFLEQSSKVLDAIDRRTACKQKLPLAEWYGAIPGTIDEFKFFCCKVGCDTAHFIDFICTSM
ncbi:hypothetical protein PMAYCL1PPCAC_15524, partial [Pristionchus mayeri]